MSFDELEASQLRQAFFPYAEKRTEQAETNGGRFAYYTSAEVATRILTKREVWLRNASMMNDFMEIEHGFQCLNAAYRGPAGEILKSALNEVFPRLFEEVSDLFNAWLPTIRTDTYLICVSEHPAEEDLRGRLSMWRAYGGATGVALVLNGAVMFSPSDVLGAYSSPVFYGDPANFASEFMVFAQHMAGAPAVLNRLGREAVRNVVFEVLRFAVLCTKHPGFAEELEWRVVASPQIRSSPRLLSEVEVIRGVPQTVIKIKLENDVELGLVGLAIPELLNRIIIGPCEFPAVTFEAFRALLESVGVVNPESRIVISDIPLRHPA